MTTNDREIIHFLCGFRLNCSHKINVLLEEDFAKLRQVRERERLTQQNMAQFQLPLLSARILS